MIYNATLIRIDRGNGGGVDGRIVTYTAGAAISVRCAVDKVTSNQRYTLGATIRDASQFCLVEKAQLAAAGETLPDEGDRVVFALDGEDTVGQTGELVDTGDRSHSFQSHFELFLKRVEAGG